MAEPTIYLVDHRHYDVVLRKTLEEYADMQERHLLKVVEMMRNYPQYKFTISQAITLANFLLRHFDLEHEFRIRLRDGQIGVAGGAYATPDTNMVSGESLYRNLLYGVQFFKKYGQDVSTASLEGSSGHSAQLPQMLKSLGFTHVIARKAFGLRTETEDGSTPPAEPRAFVWEGLDGSRLPVYTPTIDAGPLRFYEQPFQEIFRTKESFDLLNIYKSLLVEAQNCSENPVWLHVWDEERKVDEEFVDAVWQERRKKNPKQLKFAHPSEYLKIIDHEPPACLHRGELNPMHTGVYSTRIGMKQASVMLENLLVEVEKWFTAAGVEVMHFPELKFHDIWEQLFILQSHHAITGCHTDRVRHRLDSVVLHTQRDLNELRTRAISAICSHIDAPPRNEWRPLHVFNSLNWPRRGIVEFRKLGGVQVADDSGNPVPVLSRGDLCSFIAEAPSCGYNTYWYLPGGGQTAHEVPAESFETNCFRAAIADGINVTIHDKRHPVAITREGERWGDVIAREDRGSLWCKAYTGEEAGSSVDSIRLYRALLGWELIRTGHVSGASWHEFGSAGWTQSLFFYDELPHFDMHLDVDWKGSATELRLRLPFGQFAMSSVYGVPFGASARFPYQPDIAMQDGKSLVQGGEWPACGWVEYGDGEYGMTIAHGGTPGIKCEDGVVEISLLRSPIDDPKYSHDFYVPAERGAHENGTHHYRFSFMPAAGDWRTNRSYGFGREFQNPLFGYIGPAHQGRSPAKRSFLEFGPANLICTAWTANRQGHQFLRIVEAEGSPTELVWGRKPQRRIFFASPFQDRLDPAEVISFQPFEIKNIMLV